MIIAAANGDVEVEGWNVGMLECWNVGKMEGWNVGGRNENVGGGVVVVSLSSVRTPVSISLTDERARVTSDGFGLLFFFFSHPFFSNSARQERDRWNPPPPTHHTTRKLAISSVVSLLYTNTSQRTILTKGILSLHRPLTLPPLPPCRYPSRHSFHSPVAFLSL